MSLPVRLLVLLALLLGVQLAAGRADAHPPGHAGCADAPPMAAAPLPAPHTAARHRAAPAGADVAPASVRAAAGAGFARGVHAGHALGLSADAAQAEPPLPADPGGLLPDCCGPLGCSTACHALAPVDLVMARMPLRAARATLPARPDPAARGPEVALPPPRHFS